MFSLGFAGLNHAQVTQTYTYTGGLQTFVVPSCVTEVTITAYGASGSDGLASSSGSPGGTGAQGATVTGTYSVSPGATLNIYVGGTGSGSVGGFNGGGAGGASGSGPGGGAGGGASDVRLNGVSLSDRVIVAGGGGGGGNGGCFGTTIFGGNGGAGGSVAGGDGINSAAGAGGFGGVGSTGGSFGAGCSTYSGSAGTNGTSGVGGMGGNAPGMFCSTIGQAGAGGGGGYVGGGGGGGAGVGSPACFGNDAGGGGGGAGGSNYTAMGATNVSSTNGTAPLGNGSVVITYNDFPTILSTTGDTRCEAGIVNVSATPNAGTIDWYDAPTGGTLLLAGSNTYSTSIVTTTTFYAEPNNGGCLGISRVPVTATVNYNTFSDTTAIACEIFTWYGTDYTASGTPTYTLTNSIGCDSIITLNLTILNPSIGDTAATACEMFTWYGTDYTTSGTPTYTLTNAAGCDSIVTLNLTINNNNFDLTLNASNDTLFANQLNVSYQWIDCGNNNAPLNGETSPWYIPTQNGSYAVILSDGICTDTSNCETISNVGLNGNDSWTSQISVYPNPMANELTVDMHKLKASAIRVLNSVGQEVFTTMSNESTIVIDMLNNANGIYILQIQTEYGTFQERIIKK